MVDKFQDQKPLISDDIDDSYQYTRENFRGLKNAAAGYVYEIATPTRAVGIDSGYFWYGTSRVLFSGVSPVNFGVGGGYQISNIPANFYNEVLVALDNTGAVTRFLGVSAALEANVVPPVLSSSYFPLAKVVIKDDGAGATGCYTAISQTSIYQVHGLTAYPSKQVVQIVNYQTGAEAHGGTTIPYDNTIPQITEGILCLTKSITPKSTANKLFIDIVTHISNDADTPLTTALFQDNGPNAIAVGHNYTGVLTAVGNTSLKYYMPAATVSETTFTVRCGAAAGNTTLNGTNETGLFNSTLISSITIMEITE